MCRLLFKVIRGRSDLALLQTTVTDIVDHARGQVPGDVVQLLLALLGAEIGRVTHAGTDRGRASGAGALNFVGVTSAAIVRSCGSVEFFSQSVGHFLNVAGAEGRGIGGLEFEMGEDYLFSLTCKHLGQCCGSETTVCLREDSLVPH